ncbi:MAG TPA: efflux RND transporter periplasmic adaptor subunit [Tepidisphaeraceae bacterium]|nr:efflux RND transporter periplasmic adaptor subunit [Tepidisphaeraceae bacterium]
MKRKIIILIVVVVAAIGIYIATANLSRQIVLTGIVTTDDVIVNAQIMGRLQELRVNQGDIVKRDQVLGVIEPEQWKADMAFFSSSEQQMAMQVTAAESDLKYQESQTKNQILQAEANLEVAKAEVTQGQADLESARLTWTRVDDLFKNGVETAQAHDQAKAAYDGQLARVNALKKQVESTQAALSLAKSNIEQIAMRQAALNASTQQLAAAGAQKDKAQVQLGYTEIHAPIAGIVDTRAALQGEVVNPAQAIVTLINPDDLWVRIDVEESYIDRVHLGDKMTVRLPSGTTREGVVFFRGVDADYATQRDVSRTKRDIKTFEIRLRCDNSDRSLAVGMTAYVVLPLK